MNYKTAPFKVSNRCCYYIKEKPCDDWAKEHNSKPYLGMMASEGGQREESLIEHGCNYYGKTITKSAPFAPFMRNDILRLAIQMDKWYHEHLMLFEELYYRQPDSRDKNGNSIPYVPVESIVPLIYGDIQKDYNGSICVPQRHRGLGVACAVLVFTWRNVHTGSIKSARKPKRMGISHVQNGKRYKNR